MASPAASSLVLGNPLWEVVDTRRFSVDLSIKRRLCTVISGEFLELLMGTEQCHHHHRNASADETFSNWNMLVPTSGLSLLNSTSCVFGYANTSSRFICWGNQMHGSVLLAVEPITAQHRVFFCRDFNYFPHCEELFSSSWNYQRNYAPIAESSRNQDLEKMFEDQVQKLLAASFWFLFQHRNFCGTTKMHEITKWH